MGVDSCELTPRRRRILFGLCRDFLLTGRPVASASLRSELALEWSSATIRAELAALERGGLLHRAHQASGRVPTALGLQRFIDSLDLSADPSPEHRRALEVGVTSTLGEQHGLWATTRVLSELSGCLAIGFVGATRPGVLRDLQLLYLAGKRALVIITMDDGSSSMHTVDIDPTIARDARELGEVHGRLRELTLGYTLEEARDRLVELRGEREARVDRWLAQALALGVGLCQAASFDPLNMQVAGKPMLARELEDTGGEAMAEILALLEDWQRLARILCQLLPAPEDRPRAEVRLGVLPFGSAAADSCLTLVGCRLPTPMPGGGKPGQMGALALLGPARMDYGAVVPLVEYAARVMSSRA